MIHGYTCLYMVIHAYTWLYMVLPHSLLILRIEVWEGALFQILSPNLAIFGGKIQVNLASANHVVIFEQAPNADVSIR